MKKLKILKELLLKLKCQKKISQSVRIVGGDHSDYFNGLISAIIGVFNLINLLFQDKNIIRNWYYYLPFLIVSIFTINKTTSRKVKSITFFLLGIFYHLSIGDPSAIGATSFFVLAFTQYNNSKYGVVILVFSLISVTVKSTIEGDTPSQTILSIGAFIYIYGNFYKKIIEYNNKINLLEEKLKIKNRREPIMRNIDVINIKEEEKAIIKLYCNGMDYENISKFLGLNVVPKTIRKRITTIKKEYNIKSDAHFAHWAFSKV